ncbi:hypothetical protein BDR06DRAFT_316647 [Suillus hirtellus]|nr:hypothetical protein BDR06DRAFT_316647 [Suillus hirtellus]
MMDTIDESAKASCLDWSNGKFSLTPLRLHTHHHLTQNLRSDVVHSLHIMTVFLAYVLPFLFLSLPTCIQAEIPEHDHDGYDIGPNFFYGMHQVCATAGLSSFISHHSLQHSQISRSRPQQRPGRLKRLRLAMTRTPRSVPLPVPPTTTAAAFKTYLRHLFTWLPHHGGPPVVNVPFAQGRQVCPVHCHNCVLGV